jgi:hypothetical protein
MGCRSLRKAAETERGEDGAGRCVCSVFTAPAGASLRRRAQPDDAAQREQLVEHDRKRA